MIESDLIALLASNPAIGTLAGTRVAMNLLPEGETRPYIVCNLVSSEREGSMSGSGTLRNARMQINCFAASYGHAKQLAAATQAALDVAEVFEPVFLSEQDLFDSTTKLHQVAIDYSIWQ